MLGKVALQYGLNAKFYSKSFVLIKGGLHDSRQFHIEINDIECTLNVQFLLCNNRESDVIDIYYFHHIQFLNSTTVECPPPFNLLLTSESRDILRERLYLVDRWVRLNLFMKDEAHFYVFDTVNKQQFRKWSGSSTQQLLSQRTTGVV